MKLTYITLVNAYNRNVAMMPRYRMSRGVVGSCSRKGPRLKLETIPLRLK